MRDRDEIFLPRTRATPRSQTIDAVSSGRTSQTTRSMRRSEPRALRAFRFAARMQPRGRSEARASRRELETTKLDERRTRRSVLVDAEFFAQRTRVRRSNA